MKHVIDWSLGYGFPYTVFLTLVYMEQIIDWLM